MRISEIAGDFEQDAIKRQAADLKQKANSLKIRKQALAAQKATQQSRIANAKLTQLRATPILPTS